MSSTTNTTRKGSEAAKAPQAAETPAQAAAQASEDEEKRFRGVLPTMPWAIVFRQGDKVHAVIHHPIDGTSYAETGRGEGSAKGALEDVGYKLSPLQGSAPEWIAAKLPEGAALIGYATIKGFPLLPQPRA